MSNIAVINSTTSPADINKMLGFSKPKTERFNLLRINREDEDDQGKALPRGTLTVKTADGVQAYAKTGSIRVMARMYQYQRYNAKAKKLDDLSIMAPDFSKEFVSASGKIACGKLSTKKALALGDNMSKEQADAQKEVKCKQLLFVLVTLNDAKDKDGNAVVVKDVPALYKVSQSKFMDTVKMIDGIAATGTPVPRAVINITVQKFKKPDGATDFMLNMAAVDEALAPLTDVEIGHIQAVHDYVTESNKGIIEKYRKALAGEVQTEEAAKVVEAVASEVSADLDDELPF